MTNYNHFETIPITDPARPGTHLPARLSITMRFFGSPQARAGLVETIINAPGAKHAPTLASLGLCRRQTAIEPTAANRVLFHIAMPEHVASMVEFATDLADEIKSQWPGVTLIAAGTPHQRYQSHQVLVVDGGRHSYTEQPGHSSDTLVVVADLDGVTGLLQDGLWSDARDGCRLEDVVDVMSEHIEPQPYGVGARVGFIAWLDDQRPDEWMFNEANLALTPWGQRLFAVASTL